MAAAAPVTGQDLPGWLDSLEPSQPVAPAEPPALELPWEQEPAPVMPPTAEALPDWLTASDDELEAPVQPVATVWEPEIVEEAPAQPPAAPVENVEAWLHQLDQEDAKPAVDDERPSPVEAEQIVAQPDETPDWVKAMQAPAVEPVEHEGLPDWLKEQSAPPAAPVADEWIPPVEASAPAAPAVASDWFAAEEKPAAPAEPAAPAWFAAEETPAPAAPAVASDWFAAEEKPAAPAEPAAPDWFAAEEKPDTPAVPDWFDAPDALAETKPHPTVQKPEPVSFGLDVESAPEPVKTPQAEQAPRSVIRQTSMLVERDAATQNAQSLLEKGDLQKAMAEYLRIIKRGRNLESVIAQLQEATYKHPVDVAVWQTLGDAFMHANRLQEALDAYTKAETLLR